MNSTARKLLIRIGLIMIVVAVLVLAFYFLVPSAHRRLDQASTPTPTPTPFPTPTPIPLPIGKQIYNISSQGTSFKITQATFDPLDAQTGQEQTISVKVSNVAPIDSVSVAFMGDSGNESIPLALTSGINRDGVWSKTWKVALAHTKIYSAKITVVSGEVTDSVDLWFR